MRQLAGSQRCVVGLRASAMASNPVIQEGVPKSRVLVPPESWEWLTVLVAVCSADCGAASGDGLVWTQEHVFVQNE